MKRLTKDIIFESSHLSQDLAARSVRGGVTTMTAQAIQFVLHMAGTMILARLLTPADFGLIGMVTVVVGFAAMFKDAGLSMATVQRATISHEQISTLFWLNVLLSVVLGLCILLASPLVAWFYGRPELTLVTSALSLSFIITGLTIQHSALLRRHMRFGTLAVIHIVSYLINLIVVVLLALAGWRYWALVGGSLATAISDILLTLFFCPWIPGRMQKGTGVRSMLKFGGHLTGFNFLNYFARNADNVLIGRFLGADALGLYAKAYGLLMLPITQITGPIAAVATPALSRLQNDPERYCRYYYQAINVIAFITMPMVALMAALSSEIIEIILGKQWMGAAPIFKVLAFAALFQPVVNPVGWVFVSLGQTGRQLRWALVAAPLVVLSFLLGLPWGIFGVAVSYAVCSLTVLTFPGLWWAFRRSPLSLPGWCKAVRCPLVASVVMYLLVTLLRRWLAPNTAIATVLFSGITGIVCCATIVLVWRTARAQFCSALQILRYLKAPLQRTPSGVCAAS
ncbi:MAG TPA: lipopolysaccharide biosynthesis protein [Dissulfurispiraceae bacterium]|nr:lipopolysaccharide biosynthesis protein [Dissulfurispiraceae bacterium]